MTTWDTAELDAMLDEDARRDYLEFERRLELLPPAPARPRLLRLPGEAGAPPARIVTRRPRPLSARVAEVRALRRDGMISRAEARELLGLEPESAGCRVLRALRRELRRWRVTWR